MKPLVPKLTTLTEDLLQLVNLWKDNNSRTPEQLKYWPGDKIFGFAGNDHPDALRLLRADGYDGLPVFKNHSCRQTMEAAANRELLVFNPEDVIRLSLFFHLGDIKTIVLLVKAQWEKYLVSQVKSFDINRLNKTGVAEEFLPAFMDDENTIQELSETWEMLDRWFGVFLKRGLARELYSSVLNQIMISRIFYFAIESPEMAAFVDGQNELLELLKGENSAYNDVYHARNKQWLGLLQAAENAHIRLENQRTQNAEDEREWMSIFGEVWYGLTKVDLKYQSLKRQIELKKKNPEMSVEQIIETDRAIMEAELEQLQNMETAITISQIFTRFEGEATTQVEVDKEMVDRYKKVLRTIWLKTHPDKIADKGFTPEQVEILQKFYRQATEMSATDRLINPLTLERLETLLQEVEELYSNMGLNIKLNTTIKGSTLKEKVEWLEKQIKLVENELTQLKNELYSLVNDATVKQKVESMKNAETIEAIKRQMSEKKDRLEMELDGLGNELAGLFR